MISFFCVNGSYNVLLSVGFAHAHPLIFNPQIKNATGKRNYVAHKTLTIVVIFLILSIFVCEFARIKLGPTRVCLRIIARIRFHFRLIVQCLARKLSGKFKVQETYLADCDCTIEKSF